MSRKPRRPHEYIEKIDDESHHQQAYMCWCNTAARFGFRIACDWANQLIDLPQMPTEIQFEPLLWVHHIPNGGARADGVGDTEYEIKADARRKASMRGNKLKAEGTKKGIWDVHLPYPSQNKNSGWNRWDGYSSFFGLYIEFKDEKYRNHKDGGLTPEQVKFGKYAEQFYCMRIAYNWIEAVQITLDYLEIDL